MDRDSAAGAQDPDDGSLARPALIEPGSPAGMLFGFVRPADAPVAALAGLLLVVFAPWTLFPSWTPRAAVLLLALPLGALALGVLSARRDRLALTSVTFVAWVWLSALVSPAPRSATLGFVGRDLSALALTASVGLWAIGRSCTASAPHLIWRVLVAGASTNALVATVQVVVGVGSGSLALYAGRPTGFVVNPVYLGAVCAGGAVVAALAVDRATSPSAAAAWLCSIGGILSGSRVAWIPLVAVVVASARRPRRRDRLIGAGAVGAGIVTGLVLDIAFNGSGNSLERVGASTGGRWTLWGYAVRAALDRPITGHGIGRFRPAVQGRFSTGFVRATASDESQQAWFDAHNVVVGLIVAIGAIGLVIGTYWVWACARQARGPLAWGAAAIASSWMLQPVSLHTLPLVLLLLGVSMSGARVADTPWTIASRRLWVPVAGVSVVLALLLVAADVRLKSAAEQASLPSTVSAARWFGDDPVVADIVAQVARTRFGGDFADAESVHWREVAAAREPDRPYWWNLLAIEQLELGDREAAKRSVRRSLDLQPSNYLANRIDLELAVQSGDPEAVERALRVMCSLDDQFCELSASELLRG